MARDTGRVFVQSEMCASAIVILHIREENVAQVSFAEDNDMIKTFASDRADQPFRMSVLPWRVRRGRSVTNPHGANTPFENLAIDAVAIANDVSRRAVPAAGFGKLSGNPFGGWVRRHSQP